MGLFDLLFGSKPKAFPVLRGDMLQPVNNPITTVEAKRIFKEWMLKIGYLDKQEVGDHVGYFADEMRNHEQNLKEELAQAKDECAQELRGTKDEIKELKAELKICKNLEERAKLEADLADFEKELAEHTAQPFYYFFTKAESALANFKADKRAFLVEYINQQTQSKTE